MLLEKRPSELLEKRYIENSCELDEMTKRLESIQAEKSPITKENMGKVMSSFKNFLKTSDDPAVRDYLSKHIRLIRYGNEQTQVHLETGYHDETT